MSTKATKPVISTSTWPASRDDLHRYTALEIHAGVADIFSGKPRADCLPRVPQRNELLPARYGGTPMFAAGATGNTECATAMRKCYLMTADIFTKPLGPKRFAFLRDRLLGYTTTGQDTIED
jgi:hypothetical protein